MNDLYAPKFDIKPGEEKTPATSIKNHIVDFIQSIVVIGAIFALIYLFVAQPHKVSGNSMVPTFHNGDYIMTDKVTYRVSQPQRGDIIVLKNPRDENQDFIKRIIALPGDSIKIEEDQVFINDLLIQELYLPIGILTRPGNFLQDSESIKVPENQYFVFGDNRNASSDSREWGAITEQEIIGRVIFRYWPPNALGIIQN